MRAPILALLILSSPAAWGQHRQADRVHGKTFAEWAEALGSKTDSAGRIAEALATFENENSPDRCCGPVLPKDAKRYVPLLVERLRDTDPQVRENLACALGRIGPGAAAAAEPLAKLLSDPELKVRRAAASGLRGLGPQALSALDALVKALGSATDTDLRRGCAEALSGIGSAAKRRAVPALKPCLDDPDEHVRAAAVQGLAAVREPSVRERIVHLTTGALTYEVHLAAIRGVPHYGPKVALSPLAKVVRTARDAEIAEAACASLVRLGGPGAAKALIPGLSSKDEDVQTAAVLALGRLGPVALEALPRLITLALNQDASDEQRSIAALAIGGGADPLRERGTLRGLGPRAAKRAVPALIALIDRLEVADVHPCLPRRAVHALARFGAAATSALPTLRALAGSSDLDADDEDHAAVIKAAQVAIEAIQMAEGRRKRPATPKTSKPKQAQPLTPRPSRKLPGS